MIADLTTLVALVALLLVIFRKWSFEFTMPQNVKINVSFNIAPAPPPPLVSDKSDAALPDEVAGVDPGVIPVAKISGGTPPFQQPVVDPASPNPLPAGLSAAIDDAGNLTVSGTPSAPGSGTVVLVVSDSGA